MRADPTVLRAVNGTVAVLGVAALLLGTLAGYFPDVLLALPVIAWGGLGLVFPRLGPVIVATRP